MQCNAMQCSVTAMQRNAMQCAATECNAMQRNVQCTLHEKKATHQPQRVYSNAMYNARDTTRKRRTSRSAARAARPTRIVGAPPAPRCDVPRKRTGARLDPQLRNRVRTTDRSSARARTSRAPGPRRRARALVVVVVVVGFVVSVLKRGEEHEHLTTSAVQRSAVQCSIYSTVQCNAVQCAVQYSAVQYSAVQCSAVQYAQYSTVQCSAVQCSICSTMDSTVRYTVHYVT